MSLPKTTLTASIASFAITATLFVPVAAFAQVGTTAAPTSTPTMTTTSTSTLGLTAKQKAAVTKGEQEIDRRIVALNDLNTRVGAMQKVTDAFKQTLSTSIQNQVAALTALRTKIAADTDAATLRTDLQSITDSYRIYALVLPQAHIAASADRIVTIVNMMTTLGTKLQQRIASAQSSGADVSAISAALSDLSAKLSDSLSQAQAGVSVSASLVPDGGDKTKIASNMTALKAARADIQVAQKDIQAGQKNIKAILVGLQKTASTTPATTTTASTTTH